MCAQATVLCDCLRGPNSRKRRGVSQLAWDMLPKKQIRDGDVDDVNLQLRKLEILGTLQQVVVTAVVACRARVCRVACQPAAGRATFHKR